MEQLLIGAGIGLVCGLILIAVWKIGYLSGANSVKSRLGVDARSNKKTQVNLALLRIKELHDAKKNPMEIAAIVAVEYPDVAFQALREAKKLAEEMGVNIEET